MARKPKKTSARPSASPVSNDLGLSELRVRLNFLEKENEKLLKQIEKNRTELNNLTESIKELGIKIAQRSAPVVQKLVEIDRQIHDVFTEIFTGRKLGKQSLKSIESIYYHLQSDGLISPKRHPNDKNVFEVKFSEDDPDWEYHQQRSQREEEVESQKPDREELKKIRQTFLRLAEIFHPDKVSNEADKEYYTEVMKEINQAYQTGDLAKLLAIEKEQELGIIINRDSTDDLTRECAKVEAENAFLKKQSENLRKEIRLTKNTQEGEMTAHYKKITKYGGDPIEEALGELEAQIKVVDELHKFVIDFRDRRITIKEFLKGPTSLIKQPQMSDEEMLLDFLSRY